MSVQPQSRAARLRAAIPLWLVWLITAYGALLRLDVLFVRYGPIERPAWARALNRIVSPAAAHVRPPGFIWYHEPRPYVGGDPINYLRYAREMQSFYQGHVREPVFLALTRGFLWLLDDADVAVSFASACASILAIPATFALGSLFSPWIGVLASLGLAIDYDVVAWAPDGWRDDTFMCLFTLVAWTFVRFQRWASPGDAVLLGLSGGAACLTRITAASFLLPGAAWLVVDANEVERRTRRRGLAVALLIASVIVAPYLINCARTTGDPLIAINAHTSYYRAAEGLAYDKPQGVASYMRGKLSRKPLHELDTALVGLFVFPLGNKWSGFNFWRSGLATWLKVCTAAGLVMFLFIPSGRLLLVLVFTSLLPYALTWNIAGGGEWRFTMHVHPVLLVAALYAMFQTAGALASLRSITGQQVLNAKAVAIAAVLVVSAIAAYVGYQALPYFVAREAIRAGESTSIEAGDRDRAFFLSGWSSPHKDGLVTARVLQGSRGVIRFPLPGLRPYSLVLRIDPVTPTQPSGVVLVLNRNVVARLELTWNPERVGSYRLTVPPHAMRIGTNELLLVPDGTVPAGAAGPRYEWIDAREPIAIRLWYVRVIPE